MNEVEGIQSSSLMVEIRQLRPRQQSLGQDPKPVGVSPPANQGVLPADQDFQPRYPDFYTLDYFLVITKFSIRGS